jgi:hypothetical protein
MTEGLVKSTEKYRILKLKVKSTEFFKRNQTLQNDFHYIPQSNLNRFHQSL